MFADTPVNTGRQPDLDYSRGLAIIFMVICHTVMYYSVGYSDTAAYFVAYNILGGPSTAPFFMVCLGIGIVYSHRSTPQYLFKRGWMLLIGAYVLNLIRGGLPVIAAGYVLGWTPEENGVGIDLADEAFFASMIVDILQFAGLTFLFFALALKLKLKSWMILAIAIVLQLVSHCFEGYSAGNEYVTALLGLLIPSGEINDLECLSDFSFSVWFIYPAVGYMFGQLLQRVTDLDRFYRRLFWPTLVFASIYIAILFITDNNLPFSNSYYWHNLIEVFFYLSIDFATLAAFHLCAPYFPKLVLHALTVLSQDITRVYCVSWCLIIWTSMVIRVINENGVEPVYGFIASVPMVFASYYIQKKGKELRK